MADFYLVNAQGTFEFDTINAAQEAAKAYVAQGVETTLHINTVMDAAMPAGDAHSDFGSIPVIFDQGSGSTARFDGFRIATGVTTTDITITATGASFSGDRLSGAIGNKSTKEPGPQDGTSIVDGNVTLLVSNCTITKNLTNNVQAYVTGNSTIVATNTSVGGTVHGANFGSEVCGNVSISLTDVTLSKKDFVYGSRMSRIGGTIDIEAVRVTGGSIAASFHSSGYSTYLHSTGVNIDVTDSTFDYIVGAYAKQTVNGEIIINVTGSTINGSGDPALAPKHFGAVVGAFSSVVTEGITVTVEDCVMGDCVVGQQLWYDDEFETGDIYVTVKNTVTTGIYGACHAAISDVVSVYIANCEVSDEVVVTDGTANYKELVIGAGTTTVGGYLDDTLTNLVFDVTEGEAYLVNSTIVSSGVSIIADPTVTASYKLATGFAAQDTVFTVRGYEGSVQLSANNTSGTINGNDGSSYTLTMSNDELFLDIVGGTVTPPPVPTETVAEVILTISDTTHTAFGATGGWKVQNDQTVAWQDITTLGEGFQILGLGATAAQKAMPDIYVYSEASKYVGAYVTDAEGAVTGFESIFLGEAALMQVGIADFNADGVSDLLLRTADGFVGYYANGQFAEVQGLGTEWTVAALGDVDGNGRADVIIAHEAGYVGAYLIGADGAITWADLGNLDSSTAIVGAGDVNGDGTDDVIVQVGANYYGAWLCGQGAVTGFFGIGEFAAEVQDIADYNADGKDDLLFRTAGGMVGAALISGADATTWAEYGGLGDEWSTKGCGIL